METTSGSLLVSFPAGILVLFSVTDLGGAGVGVSFNIVLLGVVVAVIGDAVVVGVCGVLKTIGEKR